MCTCSPLVSLRKMTGIEYSPMNAPLHTCILQSVLVCNLPLSIYGELMKSVRMSWIGASSVQIVVDGPWSIACHHLPIAACVICFLFHSSC